MMAVRRRVWNGINGDEHSFVVVVVFFRIIRTCIRHSVQNKTVCGQIASRLHAMEIDRNVATRSLRWLHSSYKLEWVAIQSRHRNSNWHLYFCEMSLSMRYFRLSSDSVGVICRHRDISLVSPISGAVRSSVGLLFWHSSPTELKIHSASFWTNLIMAFAGGS